MVTVVGDNESESDVQTSFENFKILIADDDATMRQLLRAAISQWGYEAVEAENGEKAWEILQKPNAPDVLILDWRMPVLDGLSLCKRIREQLHYYPYIIFLTQVHESVDIFRGFEAGADEFLLKPVNFDELRNRIYAGERIIKYLKIVAQQEKQLRAYEIYIHTLEALVRLQLGIK